MNSILDEVKWNSDGLVPVIAQDNKSGDVLMMAWMNSVSLMKTLELGEAVYYSRSRQKLWHKGEESGHIQKVEELRLDCDADVILMKITQIGGISCHTGRRRCFYRIYRDEEWLIDEEILKNPREIYE